MGTSLFLKQKACEICIWTVLTYYNEDSSVIMKSASYLMPGPKRE